MMTSKLSTKAVVWSVMASLFLVIIWISVQSISKIKSGTKILVTLAIKPNYASGPQMGNYFVYRIEYGGKGCEGSRPAVMCLKQIYGKWYGEILPSNKKPAYAKCDAFIRGLCNQDHFTAKIEYIDVPNEYHSKLRNGIHDRGGMVEINVNGDGIATVENLFIGKQNWQEFISAPTLE